MSGADFPSLGYSTRVSDDRDDLEKRVSALESRAKQDQKVLDRLRTQASHLQPRSLRSRREPKARWQDNLGFPLVGIGLCSAVIVGYTWVVEGATVLGLGWGVELPAMLGAVLLMIGAGLLLTWPRTKPPS